jgi:hypothetical protein
MTEIEKLTKLVEELEERQTDHIYKMHLIINSMFKGLRDTIDEDVKVDVDIGYDVVNHIKHIKNSLNQIENKLSTLGSRVTHLEETTYSPKKCYTIGKEND